ncbi:MAG: hypothetical protein ACI9D5_002020 [Candidatus Endobugula sp.]|jgi:hypothetical protein
MVWIFITRRHILQLLNLLRTHFGKSLQDQLDSAIELASITNFDDDTETKQASV